MEEGSQLGHAKVHTPYVYFDLISRAERIHQKNQEKSVDTNKNVDAKKKR